MGDQSEPLLGSLPTTPRLSSTVAVMDGDRSKLRKTTSLDETIEKCIGDFGWANFLPAILVAMASIFDAQQVFISVFTDAQPTWHCTSSSCDTFANPTSLCALPKGAWAWDLPAHTSVFSEWALQCAGGFVSGLPASSFFMGCLVGGFLLSTLADSSLGRKNLLVLACFLMSTTGVITAFSTNIWMYSFLRFLTGFGRATIGTCALVLSTELVGSQWRGQIGIIGFTFFTTGFLSLPAIAYAIRGSSWRLLYLWTCIPTLFYAVLVHFFVHESPRWLYVRGHKEEFIQTLRSISLPTTRNSFFGSIEFDQALSSESVNIYSAIKMLIEKEWAVRRLVTMMWIGFGVGIVYYGMPLGVGNLSFNLYLSVTLNALSELPANFVTFFLIEKVPRKVSFLGFAILSGICSFGCVIVVDDHLKGLQMGLELVSFFCVCVVFNILLIYTLELFPTCARNTAMSMVKQALVLGGTLSPLLVALGRNNRWLSYGVFGVSVITCSLFVLCLPETKGTTISDTMDEEEHKQIESVIC